VASWLLAIQQYDIEIFHIKGANNMLAGILSRYPSELSVAEKKNIVKIRDNHGAFNRLKSLQ